MEYCSSGEDGSVNTVIILRNWGAILADLRSEAPDPDGPLTDPNGPQRPPDVQLIFQFSMSLLSTTFQQAQRNLKPSVTFCKIICISQYFFFFKVFFINWSLVPHANAESQVRRNPNSSTSGSTSAFSHPLLNGQIIMCVPTCGCLCIQVKMNYAW